jgi:hypothetical protein
MRVLDKKLIEIDDGEILSLVRELHQVTGVDPRPFEDFAIFFFLQQCLYPNGGGMKPVKITRQCIERADLLNEFILWKKVGKLGIGLKRLLAGFTDTRSDHLENHFGTALYMFLNRMLVPTKRKEHKRYFL